MPSSIFLGPSSSSISIPPTSLPVSSVRARCFHKLVKLRSALLTLSLFFALYYLLSRSSSHPGRDPARGLPFPSNNLKPSLWARLDNITCRTVTLHPIVEAFITPITPNTAIPWSLEELYSTTPLWSSDGTHTSKLRHNIPTLPRRVVLSPTAPPEQRLMFGFTTTVKRAKKMSELWERWLIPDVALSSAERKNRPACLVLLGPEEKPREVVELRTLLKKRGIECAVKVSEIKRYEVRVLSMIKELRSYAGELGSSNDWYIFNDDDTFWLDLRTLRRMLSRHDSGTPLLIGASTEANTARRKFGDMAYGGAGIIISQPLMDSMAAIWDECLIGFESIFGGDGMLTECAALAEGVTKEAVVTNEAGLHQFDIIGDATGFLQGGVELLNLHHYVADFWVKLFGHSSHLDQFSQILLLSQAAAFLGGDNMFKRYSFENGKTVLVNGYSITMHEEAMKPENFTRIEQTWRHDWELAYPTRELIPERLDMPGWAVKQTFYLDKVEVKSSTLAEFTFAQAAKWNEILSKKERVRFKIIWDECHHGSKSIECDDR